jgi:Dolichyl-phosphate-mannose-protein mannosyltransferase
MNGATRDKPSIRLPQSRSCLFVAIGLILIQLALAGYRADRESFTADEAAHLASGILHIKSGRFALYRVNPPFIRTVAALGPVLYGYEAFPEHHSKLPRMRPEFEVARTMVQANGPESFFLLKLARWCSLWVCVAGALAVWHWSSSVYGRPSGLVALILWTFSPLILGHAALISPDCGAAACGALAGYAFWRFTQMPGLARAAVAGFALGLALLIKSTWLVLFPVCILLSAWVARKHTNNIRNDVIGRSPGCFFLCLTVLLPVAIIVVNAGYGFESCCRPLGKYGFISKLFSGIEPGTEESLSTTGNRFRESWAGKIPVPFPANFVLGLDVQRSDFERCERSYLNGQWREEGWWYYYLYGLFVKEPVSTWLLFALAAGLTVVNRRFRGPWRDEVILLAPVVAVLLLVSSQTGMNHHVRYALPVLPFVFIWISRVGLIMERGNPWLKGLVALLLAWGIFSSLRVYPHSIAYFNEIAGGPENGHKHLNNSNIDWGQGLLHLKQWCDDHPEARPFYLAYWMPGIKPELAGIDYLPLPTTAELRDRMETGAGDSGLEPGWYSASVEFFVSYKQPFSWLNALEPDSRVAFVFWIYQLDEREIDEIERRLRLDPLVEEP